MTNGVEVKSTTFLLKRLMISAVAVILYITIPMASYAETKDEGAKRVFAIMASGRYEKHMVACSQTAGDKSIFSGPFAGYNSLGVFRDVMGKLEVQNIAFLYGDLYHPELRPPITREWEPVKVNGNIYEYKYIYYCDVASGHVAEFVNEIKGEIISVNPPRAREVIITTSDRGIRIPGDTGRFTGAEGRAECTVEWKLK
jgi:hypothetical protein